MRRILLLPLLTVAGLLLLAADNNLMLWAARSSSGQKPPGNQGQSRQRVVTHQTDVTVHLAPEDNSGKPLLHVRLANPPESSSFDDKGNPKTLSATEKSKAKGTTPTERQLPGYKGSMSDIKVGDNVTVSKFVTAKSEGKDKEKTRYVTAKDPPPPLTGIVQSVDSNQIVVRVTTASTQNAPRYGNPNPNSKKPGKTTVPSEKLAALVVQNVASDKSNQDKKKSKAKNNNQ